MEEPKFAFEDLKVYRKSLDFIDMVYDLTDSFPKEEIYKLTSQYTRAATSIAFNIAEGSGDTDAQFNRFLQIALNSLKECLVCTTIALRREYIDNTTNKNLREKMVELSKMITGLQKYLKIAQSKTNINRLKTTD
ncbi:four helix bundle protein [Allomuricauda sp. SCSIO 65647]|uniref:four helix bundle protein n=1 Tax=Allomuricauda sp. SCSIO 65647 TaxID=2908843 RepID=UPI001F362CF6|nr:four helix bundle protein [Muricauda sp. SCSIO 65647]UJH68850.1 four helix bundle protein [Muricauda sp. SCSIO 65647]